MRGSWGGGGALLRNTGSSECSPSAVYELLIYGDLVGLVGLYVVAVCYLNCQPLIRWPFKININININVNIK